MNLQIPFKLIASFIVFILVLSSVYTVEQRQNAVVFQFGEAVRIVDQPGLYFKVPVIQSVNWFDKRIQHIDAEAKELTASDGKRVIVDAFAKFRITDPVRFYKTVYDVQGVSVRLNKILESSMRKVIGTVPFISLLSSERGKIMQQIKNYVNQESQPFGIDVIDVRILRADLPAENSAAIYRRMQTEREKEARQIRAEGLEEAQRIRAKADKESQIILAEAYMQAQILKGEGDSEAAKIFNEAFGKDAEFYRFYKHIEAYKNSFTKGDATLMISPESEFLQYLHIGK